MQDKRHENGSFRIGIDHSELVRLLEKQEGLFRRLGALSAKQGQLVRQDKTDELLTVLGQRQQLVGELTGVSGELESYREQWDAVMATADEALRERLVAKVELLGEMAAEIARQDAADRKVLAKRRDGLAEDLTGVGRMQGAVAAYGAAKLRPAAKFQDMEG